METPATAIQSTAKGSKGKTGSLSQRLAALVPDPMVRVQVKMKSTGALVGFAGGWLLVVAGMRV